MRPAHDTSSRPDPPREPARDRGASTTRLLNRLGEGDREVEREVLDLLYAELHELAEHHMGRQRSEHTLQSTALVNEAWMRIAAQESPTFEGRKQFLALASRVMRSVMVDHARIRNAHKRGGGERPLGITGQDPILEQRDVDLVELNEALERLPEIDASLARIVEMRFFGGLSYDEIAEVEGVSARTVQRSWRLARAWLQRELAI